jgi:peptide methionine sulfoxide reductase msrA/msrB
VPNRSALLAALMVVILAGCTQSEAAAPSAPGVQKEMKMSNVTQPPADGLERATLAGGCFWGMEELIRKQPGVVKTIVGYTGGEVENATYRDHDGHAEAVEIVFDPKKTSYEDLLLFFFRMHDPTTLNRQGNDVGSSYRSAIFYHDDEQRRTAEKVKGRVEKSGAWKRPVVTEIVPAKPFWIAEDYHQDYLQKNAGGYTCHYVRKVEF